MEVVELKIGEQKDKWLSCLCADSKLCCWSWRAEETQQSNPNPQSSMIEEQQQNNKKYDIFNTVQWPLNTAKQQ